MLEKGEHVKEEDGGLNSNGRETNNRHIPMGEKTDAQDQSSRKKGMCETLSVGGSHVENGSPKSYVNILNFDKEKILGIIPRLKQDGTGKFLDIPDIIIDLNLSKMENALIGKL
ncbi:hypothetical protein KI387_003304, partial [Taxus chinensis]